MKTILGLVAAAVFLTTLYCSGHRHRTTVDAPVPADAVVWDALPVSANTQADANLIRFPDGFTVLIDAGEVNPLLPMLKQLGVKKIDRVLISHPHHDHFEGLFSLLQSDIAITEIDIQVPPASVCEREKPWGCNVARVRELVALAEGRGVRVGEQKAGMVYHEAGVQRLETLYVYDGEHTPVGPTDANDMSAVNLLTVGENRVVFAGDLNRALGTWITAQRDQRLRATILKVPHHGTESCAPSEFFAWVAPQLAIVPAPAELWRSDRSKRIREWFEQAHVPAYVTGSVGRVRVVLRPTSYRVFLAGF